MTEEKLNRAAWDDLQFLFGIRQTEICVRISRPLLADPVSAGHFILSKGDDSEGGL